MQTFIAVFALNGAELNPAHTHLLRQQAGARLGAGMRWHAQPGVLLGCAAVDGAPTPMPFTLDGDTWMVGDARVDGRDELAAQLGIAPATPDHELILRAYTKWGDACVDHLIGDFGFVVWDGARKKLFAARDHFGARAVYYGQAQGVVVASNQMLLARDWATLPRHASRAFIADFLLLAVPADTGIATFEALRRLPAAHTLQAQDALHLKRYWSMPIEDELRLKNPQEYVEGFREVFTRAVSDRLRGSAVSLSASGGMDSSAIAGVITQLGKSNLRGVSIATRHPRDHEGEWTAKTASHLHFPVQFLTLEEHGLFAPDPLADNDGQLDDLTQAALSRTFDDGVAAHSRDVFLGVGGDVVLYPSAGYWLNDVKKLRWVKAARAVAEFRSRMGFAMPLYVRSALRKPAPPPTTKPVFPDWLAPEFAAQHNLAQRWEMAQPSFDSPHPTHARAHAMLGHRQWQFLFERQSHLRLNKLYPFFDARVARFCLRAPAAPWCEDKLLLREAMRGILPEDVRTRRKTPFTADVLNPVFNALDGVALLDEVKLHVAPFVNLARAYELARQRDSYFLRYGITRIVSLGRWLRRFEGAG